MFHSMNVSVANDSCESTFGVLTKETNVHENIGLTNAGGVAKTKKNGDFNASFKKITKDSKLYFEHAYKLLNFAQNVNQKV